MATVAAGGDTVRLRRVCRFVRGRSYSASEYGEEGEGVPFINLKCVGKGGGFSKRGLKWFTGPLGPEYFVAEGDLLVANTDLTPGGDVVGSPILLPELPPQSSISLDLSKLVLDDAMVHGRYLFYALSGSPARTFMKGAARGTTVLHLEIDRAKDCPIWLPPIQAQRAIADYLDAETARIDALIAKKRRLIDVLQERFWADVADQIESVDGPRAPLRRALRRITDGPFGSSLTSAHYEDDGARVVRLGNVGFAEFKDEDRAFIGEGHYRTLLRHRVREGDLIMAGLGDSRNHVGRACVAPADLGPCIVKADCYCIGVDPARASADFLALYLSSPLGHREVALAARGTTRSRINLDIAKDVRVPLLPLTQQLRIVDRAESQRDVLRSTSAHLTRQVELLIEQRQACITAAVTGELEVAA